MAFLHRYIPGKTQILKNRATYTMAKPFRSTRGWVAFFNLSTVLHHLFI